MKILSAKHVPKEHLKIARHFNAGLICERRHVPEGRSEEEQCRFSRPCGTRPESGLFPALKRRAIFKKSLRDCTLIAVASLILFSAIGAMAETTNTLSDAEIQGRQLVQKLLEQRPNENFTNAGVLKIRDGKGKTSEIPIRCETVAKAASWKISYIADLSEQNTNEWHTRLNIIGVEHFDLLPNQYENTLWTEDGIKSNGVATIIFTKDSKGMPEMLGAVRSSDNTFYLYGEKIMAPFVGSDFWIADLGLEFFHWPGQKVLKKEFRRNCSCAVLESTNPNPSPNGYSRVVSWIDEESGGIVMAEAYDAQGKLLKEFYPKDVKKVNGQWQVQSMEMDNVQTGSRTRLEFDLKKE